MGARRQVEYISIGCRSTKGAIDIRKKTKAVFEAVPDARLALASEGSFGPDPFLGMVPSNHEALLFVDKQLNLEFFVDEMSIETNSAEIEFSPRDDLHSFLDKIQFPSHALIVKPIGRSNIVFKGLTTKYEVGQSIIDAFLASTEPKVILSSDMRACFNPSRLKVIEKAGEKLAKRLTSFCPKCAMFGFWVTGGVPGLQCMGCGNETSMMKGLNWKCVSCSYEEEKPREDGKVSTQPGDCEFCNP